MATEVVRELADTIIGNKRTVDALEADLESDPSADTVVLVDDLPIASIEKISSEDPSGYTMACESGYSRDVERWMRGDDCPSPRAAPCRALLSGNRAAPGLPPPPPPPPSALCELSSVAAALAVPFASLAETIPPEWISWYRENEAAVRLWIQNVSAKLRFDAVAGSVEAALGRAGGLCSGLQARGRRLAARGGLRDVFAAAMDAVLVAYAVGFLLLSLCQASLIGC